jgi:hypothetical protein
VQPRNAVVLDTASPPSQYQLSMGVRVKRTVNVLSTEFIRSIIDGLTSAYMDARNRQLGVDRKRSGRFKREDVTTTTLASVGFVGDGGEPMEIVVSALTRGRQLAHPYI